jgi:hypothetical protein
MKTLQGISGLSLVALLMVSCTGKNDLDKAPTQKPTVQAVSVAPSPSAPSPAVNAPPKGLITSTNPTAIPIAKGRIDPFSSIAVAPIKQSAPAETTQKQKTQNQPTPPQKTQNQKTQQQKTQNQPSPQQKTQNQPSPQQKTQNRATGIKPLPRNETIVKNQPLPPAPPSTDLAKAVQVNGVVDFGGRVSAIVKEPQEQISRSVSAGDYLSKGKVLVKRIELNGNREPMVILEQNGVEVIKQVSSTSGPVASRGASDRIE